MSESRVVSEIRLMSLVKAKCFMVIFIAGAMQAVTVAKFAKVQMEGEQRVERQVEHYNLDVIISVGYRVKKQKETIIKLVMTMLALPESK